ncbi:MAG: nuclear transport factor 2 family protein [Brevundimonas sp.]|nr:MAG: nuclear transport factor 2 family protein [Brevundimonas sp.]
MNRLIVALALLAAASHATGSTKAAPQPETPAAVILHYDRAWAARDETQLRRVMTPAFLYFTSRGARWTLDRWLALVLSPAYHVEGASRSEIDVVITGATAVASTRWTGRGRYNDRPFDDDQRCSLTLVKLDGAWRVASEHCTQIVASGPSANGESPLLLEINSHAD